MHQRPTWAFWASAIGPLTARSLVPWSCFLKVKVAAHRGPSVPPRFPFLTVPWAITIQDAGYRLRHLGPSLSAPASPTVPPSHVATLIDDFASDPPRTRALMGARTSGKLRKYRRPGKCRLLPEPFSLIPLRRVGRPSAVAEGPLGATGCQASRGKGGLVEGRVKSPHHDEVDALRRTSFPRPAKLSSLPCAPLGRDQLYSVASKRGPPRGEASG
jgi:hypothetical protein